MGWLPSSTLSGSESKSLRGNELMKAAVSTSKGGLQDDVFHAFGRCPTFTLISAPEKQPEVIIIQNPGAGAGGGAGIAAARAVVEAGADAVITGSCGPNALAVLLASEIKVYVASGNVGAAIKGLLEGKLASIERPRAPPKSGLAPRGLGRR